jgi:DNA polymerase V
MLMDIGSENAIQGNIFDTIDRVKHKSLMEVMDILNDKYGRNTLKLSVLGDGSQKKYKQERLSPSYTTKISDFPKTK